MLGSDQVLAFLAAATLITLSPGPDNLMVLSLGMSRGRKAGMTFGLGCALGCLSHTLLAVLGISALIAASAWAFTALKILGGLYLIWLGIMALRSKGATQSSGNAVDGNRAGARDGVVSPATERLSILFAKGLLANAINPKVLLFFLAFLPQFVVGGQGQESLQIAALGLLFTLQAAVIFGALGYFAGHVGAWFNRSPRAGLWLDRVAGAIFVALGARLLVSR